VIDKSSDNARRAADLLALTFAHDPDRPAQIRVFCSSRGMATGNMRSYCIWMMIALVFARVRRTLELGSAPD
jgi:hypothetical protein